MVEIASTDMRQMKIYGIIYFITVYTTVLCRGLHALNNNWFPLSVLQPWFIGEQTDNKPKLSVE